MTTSAGLKDLYERKRRAMSRRPSFARTTGQAYVRLRDGLCCEVEEATWRTRSISRSTAAAAGPRRTPRR